LLGCALGAGALGAGALALFYTPYLQADFSETTGAVTTGASGYLYGIAEPDVPDSAMLESVGISTLTTKPAGGLQHPIGDVTQVADSFFAAGGKQIIVYIQDMYDTWYYEYDGMDAYLARLEETVTEMADLEYSDRLVYGIFNEMDNGKWFGNYSRKGNREEFYAAWKEAFDLVRRIDPHAQIGGPAFAHYNQNWMEEFLTFCRDNDCVPDLIIWHELDSHSIYRWTDHYEGYREMEADLGLSELPICINEYGRMSDNGNPGQMVKYIAALEDSKVEGCLAYWRLANNLNDVAADGNMPNSNWWLYRWYAQMTGETVSVTASDLRNSDVGSAILNLRAPRSAGLSGLAALDDEAGRIELLCGGRDGAAEVRLDNLDATLSFPEGQAVRVEIEYTYFSGLTTAVARPVDYAVYETAVEDGGLCIELEDMMATAAYHITVTPVAAGSVEAQTNENRPVRYEAEDAKLSGNAKKTSTAYANSGKSVVASIDSPDSAVEFQVEAEKAGTYRLDVVYGNGNDGDTTDDRTDAVHHLYVDGQYETAVTYANTLSDEYLEAVSLYVDLEAGSHAVRFSKSGPDGEAAGTAALDCIDLTYVCAPEEAVPADVYRALDDRTGTNEEKTAYLLVVPEDGYYTVEAAVTAASDARVALSLDGLEAGVLQSEGRDTAFAVLYLRRGLNTLELEHGGEAVCTGVSAARYTGDTDTSVITAAAADAVLDGTAALEADTSGEYLTGIDSAGGSAAFTVACEAAGTYRMTVRYANNEEGGVHDYNVDLVERYAVVSVNGREQTVYFRSTYSWDTYKTVTFAVELEAGENTIVFTNDGRYQFNGQVSCAPHLASFTLNALRLDESGDE
ncbi:MAG: carbohydrate-binding protein, partial [Clostridiales bacterium]|nr:carbohydrate-binding protein [Clostridiales bacterium]